MATMPLRSTWSPTIHQMASGNTLGLAKSHPGISILRRCAETLARPLTISFPWTLGDIWEGVLRAVPKKKTTYSRTRSRQLAGKALKDVTTLNKCPGCGRVKRAHTLCIYCVHDIKQMFKNKLKIQQRNMSTQKNVDSNSTAKTTKTTNQEAGVVADSNVKVQAGQKGGSV